MPRQRGDGDGDAVRWPDGKTACVDERAATLTATNGMTVESIIQYILTTISLGRNERD
jgi:hypothetical protein